MKGLSNVLAKYFYDTCKNIKNSKNRDDLNFYVGVACGIASGLILSDVIGFDCYTTMHLYISVARDECKLGEGDY